MPMPWCPSGLSRLVGEVDEEHWFAELSATEQDRANRFHFEADRRQFLLSHYGLRAVLGQALGTAPRALEFATGRHGKPELAGRFLQALSFNLAHCDDLAVIAIAHGCPVGVDVERVRTIPDALAVARVVFSKRELQDLEDAPASERSRLFLHYWTRKEAVIKAMGESISDDLSKIDTFTPRDPTGPLQVLSRDEVWSVEPLKISNGHVAAVAARASTVEIHQAVWRW